MYTEKEVKDSEDRAHAVFGDALRARTSRWPGLFPRVESLDHMFAVNDQHVTYGNYSDVASAPVHIILKAFQDGLATFLAQVDEHIQQWYVDRLSKAELLEKLTRSL